MNTSGWQLPVRNKLQFISIDCSTGSNACKNINHINHQPLHFLHAPLQVPLHLRCQIQPGACREVTESEVMILNRYLCEVPALSLPILFYSTCTKHSVFSLSSLKQCPVKHCMLPEENSLEKKEEHSSLLPAQ